MSPQEYMATCYGVPVTVIEQAYYSSLADCKEACKPCAAPEAKPLPWKNKKDENPMNYASATVIAQDTTEKDQRRYLINELQDVYETAKIALKRKFGLPDDEAPTTLADTIKRIQDGL